MARTGTFSCMVLRPECYLFAIRNEPSVWPGQKLSLRFVRPKNHPNTALPGFGPSASLVGVSVPALRSPEWFYATRMLRTLPRDPWGPLPESRDREVRTLQSRHPAVPTAWVAFSLIFPTVDPWSNSYDTDNRALIPPNLNPVWASRVKV